MKKKKLDFGKFQIEEIKPSELNELNGAWCGIGNYGGGFCAIGNHPDEDPRDDSSCLISNHQ
ncbi:MAG: hypothetical protein WCX31_13935 [Salinivirgaceae bacterium]